MKKGFTLVEILIAVAVMGILLGLSFSVYQALSKNSDLNLAAATSVQTIRRAQLLSQAMKQDDTWGVKLQTGEAIIFKGTSFSGRTQSYDEIYSLPGTVSISGDTEIVFTKFTGFLPSAKSITLTIGNKTKTININVQGKIEY
ncbi:MAG: type II secretion system protein [Patescibacteria group bacterium]|jgi:prepilin-type N-terminal cleavage/methylation domain-containing protein